MDTVLDLTFPYNQHLPAKSLKFLHLSQVPFLIAAEFLFPELDITFGIIGITLFATMPKTPINEDRFLFSGEGDIRTARGFFPIKAITFNASRVHCFPHR